MNRFHPKYHRYNHHTDATAGSVDSSHDPIASQYDPFQGNFYLNGTLSAQGIDVVSLTADNITTTTLHAATAFIEVTDMTISELSGFTVLGPDYNLSVPTTIDPNTEPLVLLNGVGVSGTSWASFYGDMEIGRNVDVGGTLSLNGDLDMNWHSITNVASASIGFQGGASIGSNGTTIVLSSLSASAGTFTDGLTVSGGLSANGDINFTGMTTVDSNVTTLTASNIFATLMINGSSFAMPLYMY